MKWVNPKEEMPEEGRRILVAINNLQEVIGIGYFDGRFWHLNGSTCLIPTVRVRYWAPIARLPEE